MFLMACILLAVTVQSQVVYIHFTDTFRTQVVNSSAEYLLFEKGYKEQGTLRINLKDEIYWPFIVVAKKYRRDTIYTETLVLEDYFVD
jgi:hypothetical protein